jgi:predicted phosphodiesterase
MKLTALKFLNMIKFFAWAITVSLVWATGCGAKKTDTENNTADTGSPIRIGLISDIHYAEKPHRNNRHYTLSPFKLKQAVETFNERGAHFLVLLGDNIDEMDRDTDLAHLRAINDLLDHFNGDRYFVMGNHDLGSLTKDEFLAETRGSAHYSFVRGSFQFLFLDGNFRQDGVAYSRGNFEWTDSYIPSGQLEWLTEELRKSKADGRKAIVFIHQILTDENDPHGVKNAAEVRDILEKSGNVVAVFQGHQHAGGYENINGIHYVMIHPMVVGDTNSFAELTISKEGMVLKGYGRQPDVELKQSSPGNAE